MLVQDVRNRSNESVDELGEDIIASPRWPTSRLAYLCLMHPVF